MKMFPARLRAPSAWRLQRSVEQEQMEAVAPPPSWRVLQPSRTLGPPHSLVRRETSSHLPLVTRQDWEGRGQVTTHCSWGLNWWQWEEEEL